MDYTFSVILGICSSYYRLAVLINYSTRPNDEDDDSLHK